MSEVFRKHIPTAESLIAEGIEPEVAQQIIEMYRTGDLPEAPGLDGKGSYINNVHLVIFNNGDRIQVKG